MEGTTINNDVKTLKEFFGTPDRPVSASEFMEFWKSCSSEFKEQCRTADLTV